MPDTHQAATQTIGIAATQALCDHDWQDGPEDIRCTKCHAPLTREHAVVEVLSENEEIARELELKIESLSNHWPRDVPPGVAHGKALYARAIAALRAAQVTTAHTAELAAQLQARVNYLTNYHPEGRRSIRLTQSLDLYNEILAVLSATHVAACSLPPAPLRYPGEASAGEDVEETAEDFATYCINLPGHTSAIEVHNDERLRDWIVAAINRSAQA